jgi:hypothetical protein
MNTADSARRFLHAVLSLPTVWDMLAAVEAIAPDTPEAQEWARTALERILDAAESKPLDYMDGESVVRLSVLYRDIEYIKTR